MRELSAQYTPKGALYYVYTFRNRSRQPPA